jgi:hypothetical protein
MTLSNHPHLLRFPGLLNAPATLPPFIFPPIGPTSATRKLKCPPHANFLLKQTTGSSCLRWQLCTHLLLHDNVPVSRKMSTQLPPVKLTPAVIPLA